MAILSVKLLGAYQSCERYTYFKTLVNYVTMGESAADHQTLYVCATCYSRPWVGTTPAVNLL